MCLYTHSYTLSVSVGGITAGTDAHRQTELRRLQCDYIMLLIGWPNWKRSLWDNRITTVLCVCIYFVVYSVCACVFACDRVQTPKLCLSKACQSPFLHFMSTFLDCRHDVCLHPYSKKSRTIWQNNLISWSTYKLHPELSTTFHHHSQSCTIVLNITHLIMWVCVWVCVRERNTQASPSCKHAIPMQECLLSSYSIVWVIRAIFSHSAIYFTLAISDACCYGYHH